MGSDIFAVSLVRADKYNFNSSKFTEATDEDFTRSILVQKFTNEAFNQISSSLVDFENNAKDKITAYQGIADFLEENPDYKFTGFLAFANDVGGDDLVKEIVRGQSIFDDIKKSKIEVVLYKGQDIYKAIEE